jgi:hypothetical protein
MLGRHPVKLGSSVRPSSRPGLEESVMGQSLRNSRSSLESNTSRFVKEARKLWGNRERIQRGGSVEQVMYPKTKTFNQERSLRSEWKG